MNWNELLNPPPTVAFFMLSAAALVAFCAIAAYWAKSQRRAQLVAVQRVHAAQARAFSRVMWDEESEIERSLRAGKLG